MAAAAPDAADARKLEPRRAAQRHYTALHEAAAPSHNHQLTQHVPHQVRACDRVRVTCRIGSNLEQLPCTRLHPPPSSTVLPPGTACPFGAGSAAHADHQAAAWRGGRRSHCRCRCAMAIRRQPRRQPRRTHAARGPHATRNLESRLRPAAAQQCAGPPPRAPRGGRRGPRRGAAAHGARRGGGALPRESL